MTGILEPRTEVAEATERGLSGRVALITGAGSGLGAATAEVLAAAGMHVLVADVAAGRERVAERLVADGWSAQPVDLDVTDPSSAERAVEHALSAFGSLDVLVNNAGVDRTAPFDELGLDDWDRIIAVNLRGPVVMSRAAWSALRTSGGHIVNIASTAAKRAWTEASAYHATKWGLLGFSHALHAEGRPVGIKVTAVIAGGMRTPFLLERFPDLDPGLLQDPRNVARTIRFVLEGPAETVVPEVMVLPMRETSWP
jgi:NAD(P)-dependent dehydrogenase (short-subunit alcohol dehydrogenase family)